MYVDILYAHAETDRYRRWISIPLAASAASYTNPVYTENENLIAGNGPRHGAGQWREDDPADRYLDRRDRRAPGRLATGWSFAVSCPTRWGRRTTAKPICVPTRVRPN